jgi:peptidoglycan/LPS O-acetylase OafA/YrhL
VAGVLLYHGGVSWMPGGFLGVDVFFVLSGYLITSLLLAELADGGRIDLWRFWLGRARRLLPAALLLIATCLLVYAIFLPGDLGRARGDAIASALYVNNWHQILAGHSYFQAFGRPSMFEHLWSLAVEEQFYLLWPLGLGFGLARLGRGRMAALTLAVALASVALMAILYHPHGDASRVYYGTDTRAAQLLAGALLAFAWPPARLSARTGRGAGWLLDGVGLLGLVVLLAAMIGLRDSDAVLYRGGFELVALASVALIAAIAHPAAHAGRVLGLRPLRWIGRRSYGIYLGHWPVMVLTRPGVDVRADPTLVLLAQCAVTVAIAALSYRYVEMPVRNGRAGRWARARLDRWRPRQRLAAVAGVAVAFLVLAGFAFGRPVERQAGVPGHRALATDAARRPPTPAAGERDVPAARRAPLAVGASVMLAAEPALKRRLGRRARIDAAVGRQPDDILARLEAYSRHGRLPDRVIVQIGDNGPLTDADMARLHADLRGIPRVVLVNIRVLREWETEANAELAAAVRHWPQARVADWYSASADPSLLYDEAHPNVRGEQVYARVVAQALRR